MPQAKRTPKKKPPRKQLMSVTRAMAHMREHYGARASLIAFCREHAELLPERHQRKIKRGYFGKDARSSVLLKLAGSIIQQTA